MITPAPQQSDRLCAISGTGGYVGGAIRAHFEEHCWTILELTRHPRPGTSAVAFQLGSPLHPASLQNVKILVHCAYDFRALGWDEIHAVNVEGSRRLLQSARDAGVQKIVFISSISAYEGCRSLYGRAKLEIEKIALAAGALVIRPGLVYGDSPQAMFGKLVAQVRKSSVLPLFGGGSQIQYLVHSDDLAAFIRRYAEGDASAAPHPLTAAHEKPWTFRELLTEIGRGLNRKPRFIAVPWRLVWAVLKTAELLGLRLNFRSDSLVSLLHQNPNPDFTANRRFGLECRPFDIASIRLTD